MTIDEIFAALPEEVAQDVHEYLVIDPVTRTIQVPQAESIFGVEIDSNSERKYFICPRYVGDKLDLAACFLSIKYRNANGEKDEYLVEDTAVNGEYVTFSWLISSKVVAYKGVVQFRFYADTGAGKDWGTTLAQGESLEGLEPDTDTVEEETSDVVTQLRAMVTQQTGNVEAVGAAQVAVVKAQGTASTQEAVEAIQAQGAATLATIPAEYTELEATVDRLTRGRAATIVCQAQGTAIQVQDASNDPLQGLRIFGKSTQDGTPTPDAPVEIVSTPAPVVTVCGKNLLPYPYLFSQFSKDGVTVTANADGTIVVNGTATANVWVGITENVVLSAGTYTLSIFPDDWVAENGYVLWQGKNTHTGTIVATIKEATSEGVGVVLLNGTTYNNVVLRPKIERGSVATDYEPYTGHTLTITTPGSLPGIPVASGGNYTDANGQQWICDEVDLARGVYVQRIQALAFDGTEAWGVGGEPYPLAFLSGLPLANDQVAGVFTHGKYQSFSSTLDGFYAVVFANGIFRMRLGHETTTDDIKEYLADQYAQGNPVKIQYILAAPAETPLTDVELQAFRALHSNKPTTTVLNDAGAHMVLEYAADPKTYIDNKLAALIAANN